jgi:pyruvate/2-oxoglutarate dehydrogenase complex dihydrolipoamide acyltransferase (E2) component
MAELQFRLPNLGMNVEEAIIEEWLVGVGDTIEEGKEIVVVATDKAQSGLPAPYSGTVSVIHVPAGETVEVGTLLCTLTSAS